MGIMTPAKLAEAELRAARNQLEEQLANAEVGRAEIAKEREALAAREAESSQLMLATQARAEAVRLKLRDAEAKQDAALKINEQAKAAKREAEKAKAAADAARVAAEAAAERLNRVAAAMEEALAAMKAANR